MEWNETASLLLEKVPPFVQKTVREKVETLARERGKTLVTEAEVMAARDSFMNKPPSVTVTPHAFAKKSEDNKKLSILRKYPKYFDNDGNPVLYQIKCCRGAEVNCPFLIADSNVLADKIRNRLEELKFTEKLMNKIEGQILPHHSLKIAISGCPNSCSMPQIKDFGVHAIEPVFVDPASECIECMKCVETCREDAITVQDGEVTIDMEKCVHCGLCAKVCPSGSIKARKKKISGDDRWKSWSSSQVCY
ncbi:MAG: hypothetical protein AYP45_02325 [Candidatus Brocadia carolinensis]|uniref:4Fe-4S ferredoxin-type domain-containing protein n=1 Tax=Candidatus Brocadia carolinensis TaxID=1004156 RepID=A0A1V4AX05_9BACT|nr:MAG: hypothetical protein AYP45_02325 [Candidatus Brocadia caroliniensis]